MQFTTLKFLIFFLAAALGWYGLPGRLRGLWLLGTGLVFYWLSSGAFALLLLADIAVAYAAAQASRRGLPGRRRLWTALGVLWLLGGLAVLKYAAPLARALGAASVPEWLAPPAGVSFFSFVLSAYLFDVGRGRIEPERNVLDFSGFAVFFPTMLAGPINRAEGLLPQLRQPGKLQPDRLRRGLLRFSWGAFKKLAAADNLGRIVDAAYADPSAVSGGAMLAAVLAYSMQIYLDFSAYSDMAIGCADMLGITIPENFRAPYLSRSVREFWKKWHISLTDWFRDYLYFPLGGSRRGRARTLRNVLIVFAVSGLWHGGALTFLIWGLLNGLYQAAELLAAPLRSRAAAAMHIREDSALLRLWQGVLTFLLLTAAWIFFRAESPGQAVYVIKHILLIVRDGFGFASLRALVGVRQGVLLAAVLALCIREDVCIARGRAAFAWAQRGVRYWLLLAALALAIGLFGVYGAELDAREFVYFRF